MNVRIMMQVTTQGRLSWKRFGWVSKVYNNYNLLQKKYICSALDAWCAAQLQMLLPVLHRLVHWLEAQASSLPR